MGNMPDTKLSLLDLFRRGFDPATPRTTVEILVFLATFAAYEAFIHESAPLLGAWTGHLVGLEPPEHVQERLFASIFYVALATVILLTARVFQQWRGRAKIGAAAIPPQMQGLIVNLSRYSPGRPNYPQSRYATLLDLHGEVNAVLQTREPLRIGALRHEILKTNLGPFYVAVEYHCDTLKKCWLTTTPETAAAYEVGAGLVKLICGDRAVCEPNALPDANNVSEIGLRVRKLYETRLGNLRPQDVIVDITGGTATMSAGLILASLSEDRRVQYLGQDIPLVTVVDGVETALTPAEIVARGALQSVQTSPEDVRDVIPLKGH